MRSLTLFLLVGYAALGLAAASPQASPDDALDRYARGDHAPAVAAVDAGALTAETFTAVLERWIAAGAAEAPSRTLVAAAFALDVVWAATRQADQARNVAWMIRLESGTMKWRAGPVSTPLLDMDATLPVVAWACAQLEASQVRAPREVTPAERQWWLASIGILQNAGRQRALEGGSRPTAAEKKAGLNAVGREEIAGHLAHARARLGDDAQIRLAEVIAAAGFLRAGGSLGRLDVLRDDARTDHRQIAAVQKRMHALAAVPALTGEIAVREGYFELLLRKRASALARFDRVRGLTEDPFLIATADYMSGWIHEQEGRGPEAIAAYRQAHVFAPRVRNLSTLLAAQLFLVNERAEAYRILDAGLTTVPPVIDLVTLLNRGDAWRVPRYIQAMREALR